MGSHSHLTENPAFGAGKKTDAVSGSLQKSKLKFGDESSGMVRGAGMSMAGRAAGRLAYGVGRYAYRRLREDAEQEAEGIDDSAANDAIHQAERAGTGAVRMASARSPNGRKSVRREMSKKQRLAAAASRQRNLTPGDLCLWYLLRLIGTDIGRTGLRIIISPAKQMRVDTDTFACSTLPVFIEKTEILMQWIRSLSYEEQKKLRDCSDKIARQSAERFAQMNLRQNLTPALLSYDGIQYTYMAPAVFEDGQYDYVQNPSVPKLREKERNEQ